ncbi:hypothetical protein MesoLj131b_70910 (plasmid) [Mesorhizobium sp. 131-2-5]|uniref:hypothetical protein n=1 Tax=Mesorhizobium sp. 131-2-5 TaxID=2744519 RepID=UPI0018EBE03B|nr:hypothetical protein [Mesorhizobium sp. 131-2-5]BCH05092.1 hypothetical protein MesoLj131b_70910 [Mesorhizobium sp. 131-2-5]
MKWKSSETLVGFLVLTVALFPLSHRVPAFPRLFASLVLLIGGHNLVGWVQGHMENASFAHWWAAISLFLIAIYLGMRARDVATNDESSPFLMMRLAARWRWKALFCVGLTLLLVVLLATRR